MATPGEAADRMVVSVLTEKGHVLLSMLRWEGGDFRPLLGYDHGLSWIAGPARGETRGLFFGVTGALQGSQRPPSTQTPSEMLWT